jgi:hypothetical protein
MAFKMKGSPMARNYGHPFKDTGHGRDNEPDHTHGDNQVVRYGDDGFMTVDKDGNAVSRQQAIIAMTDTETNQGSIPLVEGASDEDKAARTAKVDEQENLAAERRAAEVAKKK